MALGYGGAADPDPCQRVGSIFSFSLCLDKVCVLLRMAMWLLLEMGIWFSTPSPHFGGASSQRMCGGTVCPTELVGFIRCLSLLGPFGFGLPSFVSVCVYKLDPLIHPRK